MKATAARRVLPGHLQGSAQPLGSDDHRTRLAVREAETIVGAHVLTLGHGPARLRRCASFVTAALQVKNSAGHRDGMCQPARRVSGVLAIGSSR